MIFLVLSVVSLVAVGAAGFVPGSASDGPYHWWLAWLFASVMAVCTSLGLLMRATA